MVNYISFERCTINDGVVFIPFEAFRLICLGLYEAAVAVANVVEILDKQVFLKLPSKASFLIIDNYEVYNFVPTQVKYWALKVSTNIGTFKIPLYKMDISERLLQDITRLLETPWVGSEDLYYWDEVSETYKKGTDYDPVKTYNTVDFAYDVGHLILILVIAYVLIKAGGYLAKIGRFFLEKYFALRRHKAITGKLDNIEDLIDSLMNSYGEKATNVVEMDDRLLDLESDMEEIKARLGVRLILSK